MRKLVEPAGWRGLFVVCGGLGPLGVGRRDQPHLLVECAQEASQLVGARRVSRDGDKLVERAHVALDAAARLGEQGLEHAHRGLLVRLERTELNVSSRNAMPTPWVPPTAFKVAGVHTRPLTISANKASRTGMTRPSWARPSIACARKAS